MTNISDILIVGGGLSGMAAALAAANAAAKAGVKIVILDRGTGNPSNSLQTTTQTTTIDAASFSYLSRLTDLDISQTGIINRIEISAASGVLAAWDNDPPLAYVFRNADLQKSLVSAVADNKNITLLGGHSVTGFAPQHRDYGYAAALASTDKGDFAARLVVGADGGSSPLRQMANLETLSRSPHQIAIIADIKTSAPHHHIAAQRFLQRRALPDNKIGGTIALMPLVDSNLMSLVWCCAAGYGADLLSQNAADFSAELNTHFGDGFGDLTLASEPLGRPLNLHHCWRPFAPRLLLVGDAAHAIHPLAGQGYNLAIGDAWGLASMLTNALDSGSDFGSLAMLRRYGRKRFLDTAGLTLATSSINAAVSMAPDSVSSLVLGAMAAFGRSPLRGLAPFIAKGGLKRFD